MTSPGAANGHPAPGLRMSKTRTGSAGVLTRSSPQGAHESAYCLTEVGLDRAP